MRRTVLVLVTLVAFAAGATPPAQAGLDDFHLSKQWGFRKIKAEEAWAATGATGNGIVVAVVDTGVDLDHPDLEGNLASGIDFVEPEGVCATLDGVEVCVQDHAQDEHGHGTHVAGIIGAVANLVGVVGVAPDVTILPVRVLDEEGSGTIDAVASGIRWAADHGAKVINLSLGFDAVIGEVLSVAGVLDPIYDALEYAWSQKHAVPVIAAGNDSFPLCSDPAKFPHGLCVGATDQEDKRTFYSNSDLLKRYNYVLAPGGSGACEGRVFSTHLTGETDNCNSPDGYAAFSGTSMAAPHVAGVAALLAEMQLSNVEIVARILATADDLGATGHDRFYGHGRVNAYRAVNNITTP